MHMYLLETFKIVNNNYFTLKSPSVGLSKMCYRLRKRGKDL